MENMRKIVAARMVRNRAKMDDALNGWRIDEVAEIQASFDERERHQDWPLSVEP